jgi:uncharacterized protein (DUF1778 family)
MGLREYIHAKTAPAVTPKEPKANGVLVLNAEQSKHFQECMTKPKEPTEALKVGVQRLQELLKKHG